MRLFQCIQCSEKLGPGNATLGSEICNKCRMQQAGIKQTDRAHTRPQGTAPQDYQELVYELRPVATPPGYLQLVYELRPVATLPSALASVRAGLLTDNRAQEKALT